MMQDPAQMRLLGGPADGEKAELYLQTALTHWALNRFGLWMLFDRESGACIGRALLRRTDSHGALDVEVGYGFDESAWGNGLATEITVALLAIARRDLGLDTVVAITTPTNPVSQRVLEKCGLTLDQTFGSAESPRLLYRIRWEDDGRPGERLS